MNVPLKQEWISTILIDRLKYVVKERAELYISYYEKNLVGKMHHVKNKEDVYEFWQKYDHQANGGDTHVGDVVEDIKIKVESGDFYGLGDLSLEEPEILIIHDGYRIQKYIMA